MITLTGLPLGTPGISAITNLADSILTLALVLALYYAWTSISGHDERVCRRVYARRARRPLNNKNEVVETANSHQEAMNVVTYFNRTHKSEAPFRAVPQTTQEA